MSRPHRRRLSKGRVARQSRLLAKLLKEHTFGEHYEVFTYAPIPENLKPKTIPIIYVRQPTTK